MCTASVPSWVRDVGNLRSRTSRPTIFISAWPRAATSPWLVSTRALPLTLYPAPPPIQRHREDNDHAGDDLLDPVRQALLRAADLDDGHDGRARNRADNTSPPA